MVHTYGQPCKIDEIKKFARKKDLFIIEDCAEALGAKYKGRLVGLDGDCSCHSFYANKNYNNWRRWNDSLQKNILTKPNLLKITECQKNIFMIILGQIIVLPIFRPQLDFHK